MEKFQCVISADLAQRVYAAVSTEQTRYYLNGFLVEACAEGGALLVATDGSKMLVFRDPLGVVSGTAIVSLKPEMLKALGAGRRELGERVLIVDDQRAAIVANVSPGDDRAKMIGQAAQPGSQVVAFQAADVLIDGHFPDWRRALPQGDRQPVLANFNAAFIHTLAKALAPAGQKAAFAHLMACGSDVEDARNSPHLMFATAFDGFAVIMPVRSSGEAPAGLPSWVAASSNVVAIKVS